MFYLLTIVSFIFRNDVGARYLMEFYSGCNFFPLWVGCYAKGLGGLGCVLELAYGCSVGKGIVIDSNGILIGPDYSGYAIGAIIVMAYTAYPVVGTVA